jgi:hypothetical protein
MFQHPELMMTMANQRRSELIAEADRARLLNSVRGHRGKRARHTRNGRSPA